MSRQKKAPKRGKKQSAGKSTPEIVSSSNECHINILLDDLVLDIFFNFELAKIGNEAGSESDRIYNSYRAILNYFVMDLSLVCRKWRQLTLRQEYWRFHSIHQWGKNIVPNSYEFLSGGSIQVDLKKYMIPTFKIGNTTTVDWRKYFKIRYFWEEVKFALDRHYYLIREDVIDPIIVREDEGRRALFMPEGITGISAAEYEEWAEFEWSFSDDDEDEIEFGDYLDDEEYRKALKLDEEYEPVAVSYERYEQDMLRKPFTHRYTEDLFTESILTFFMRVPRREKAKLDLPERFPRLLSIFSIEVFPLLLEAKFYPALIVATKAIYRCAILNQIFGTPYEISQGVYDLCLLVEDKPKLMVPLLFAACYKFKMSKLISQTQTTLLKNLLEKMLELTESQKILAANKAFDKVLKKMFKKFDEEDDEDAADILESFIEPPDDFMLVKEKAKNKRSMTKFVDPIRKYELFGIVLEEALPKFGGSYWQHVHSNERLIPTLIDFISSKFTEATDAQKVVLLTLSDIAEKSLDLCLKLFPLACEATKHKNDDVAFAAYTLLFRQMSTMITYDFPEKLTKTVFEALLRGLDRFPANSLCIIVMLTKLLANKSKLITDKQLKDLNTKILANLAKPEEFFHKDVVLTSEYFLFNDFSKLGEIFGQRMAPFLPEYRKAIMEAGKTDLNAAVILNKNGDKFIMEMNSSPQRWFQYAELGKHCGVKNFEKDLIDFVKEIMKHQRELKKQDLFGTRTEKEFHALFADVVTKILEETKGNKRQYETFIESILGTFPEHITKFGKKFFSGKCNNIGNYPRTPIPETAAQLQVALTVINVEKEKPKKKGKKQQQQEVPPSDEQLVNYVYSQHYLDTLAPKEKDKKSNKKKFKPEFNSIVWEGYSNKLSESDNIKKELNQIAYNTAKQKVFELIDKISKKSLLLKAFHVILAFAKVDKDSVDISVIDLMYQTYEKLRDEFDESTQCFYIQSMASLIAVRLNQENVDPHVRHILAQYAAKLVSEYFRNSTKRYQPIVAFLSIAVQLNSCWPSDKNIRCELTYDTIKLMLLKSPLGVYQAAIDCSEMSLLFVDHPENKPLDEQYVWRLHSLMLLGHHFGIHMLYSINSVQSYDHTSKLNRFKFNMLPTKIVDYLNRVDRSKVKPQLIDRMERFLVLYKVYLSEGFQSNIRFVNLYNSMYYETETIKKVIRGKKFTSGIAELDKRAKKWENIYDLNKTDFYNSDDELSSDDESEENSEEDIEESDMMDDGEKEENSGDDYNDEDEMDDDDDMDLD